MKKLILWLSLLWAILAAGFGVLVLGSGIDLDNIALRQDVRQLISAAPDAAKMLPFYDSQWLLANRTAEFLVLTGLLLLIVCVIALRSLRAKVAS